MPSGLRETSKPHFEIYYEAPWGGVASNMAATDIQPNQMVTCDGLTIRNGVLCYTNIAAQTANFELTLITPTNIAPGGGVGGYLTVGVTQIETYTSTGTGSHAVTTSVRLQLTGGSVADIIVGSVIYITGNSNPILNIGFTITSITRGIITANFSVAGSVSGTGGSGTFYSSTGGGNTPQDWPNAYICLIFNCANYLCAIDQYGFSYIATVQTDGQIQFQLDQTATGGPITSFGIPTAFKVVAGVAYISYYIQNTTYAYTPTVSFVVATDITAGQFIDIFDEYMIQLNTNTGEFHSGGTPLGQQPCAINWSGPDEFTTWDPSLNELAGYQVLTSVEDYISGFVAVDNVGYIFKREGVTQITATGVAIQPFNFTTYWNSVAGQGLIYPQTLKQFGRIVFLATDSDVYSFYGGVFTPIAEPARAAIYSSFNTNPAFSALSSGLTSAGFSIYPFNDSIPISEYMFISITSVLAGDIIFWFYHPNDKTWTSLTISAASLLAQYITGASNVTVNWIKTASIFLNYVTGGTIASVNNLNVNLTYINFNYTLAGVNTTQTYLYFNVVDSPTANTTGNTLPPGNLNLVFRKEEIKLDRQPTIRRVVIKAAGSGTLDVSVSGVSFGAIVLDGTNNLRIYKTQQGIYTGIDPQLSIQSTNFVGQIVKTMMAGTYADGDID